MHAGSSTSSFAFTLVVVAVFAATHGACSAGGGADGDGGAGASSSSGSGGSHSSSGTGGETLVGGFTAGGGSTGDGGGCGYAEFPTERDPGMLLLVYDQSCSMVECPDGSTEGCAACPTSSKWELAQAGMQAVLQDLPDELRMGLILYPSGGGLGCNVASSPDVAPAPLSSTRQPILDALNITPDGGGTPTFAGLQLGYQTLAQLSDTGNKAVLLVTDGAWNCGGLEVSNMIFDAATLAYDNHGFKTFVVGIQEPSALLSHLAHVGGTDRVVGCNPDYATLQNPLVPTCESSPDTCCNYTIGQDVTTELVAALEAIASQLLDSCVFPVPKGTDPSQFDPSLVNVYVDGELVYPDDQQGWGYLEGGTDFIEIYGALCDELLAGTKDEVVIQLGCPTVPPR